MRFIYILFLAAILAASSLAQTILFEDDFEGSIRPEWVNYAGGFTVTTSNAQHGNYAVTTSIRDRYLRYDLGVPMQDLTFEGWFFDVVSADPYEMTLEASASTASGFAVGIDTFFDHSRYVYRLGAFNWISTNIVRSNGWHIGQIYRGVGTLSILIDGIEVYQETGGSDAIRFVSLATNGAAGQNPPSPYYLDNVRVYEGPPVPEPATIGILGLGLVLIARRSSIRNLRLGVNRWR